MAGRINTNTEGHSYNFSLEMQRDTARLCFAAAEITGNVTYLQFGITILDRVIASLQETTPSDPTITPLILFERVRAARKVSSATFVDQHMHYREAFTRAMDAENYERAATLAAWELIDAKREGNKQIALEAQTHLSDRRLADYQHIPRDQQRKERLAGIKKRARDITRRFVSNKRERDISDAMVRIG